MSDGFVSGSEDSFEAVVRGQEFSTPPAARAAVRAAAPRARHKFSRFMDYVGKSELTKQVGHGPDVWPLVVVKELVDNAIDHAEEIGRPPVVEVTVTPQAIEVRDRGAGILDDVIDGALSLSSALPLGTPSQARRATHKVTRGRRCS